MPTDLDLYVIRHTRYKDYEKDATAAQIMAYDLKLSYDSVRGRLSRVDPLAGKVALAKHYANKVDDTDPSADRQLRVIARSQEDFERKQKSLRGEQAALFMSDVHVPYTRWDAFDLTLQIARDIPNLVYVSALNDLCDNNGFGRWEDSRTHNGSSWSRDISYLRATEKIVYESVKEAAPKATLLGLLGNHDRWFFDHLRKQTPQVAETILAEYMEWLYSLGVLQFTRGFHENSIEISPNLVWWHGQFASKNVTANAKNTLSQFMKNGVARSVVVGHTHRPALIAGSTVGISGVNFYNSPCLSRVENVPYMRRDPSGWELGVVVNYFVPNTRQERGYIVQYIERGNTLVAYFNGKEYKTKLDKSCPDDYK